MPFVSERQHPKYKGKQPAYALNFNTCIYYITKFKKNQSI